MSDQATTGRMVVRVPIEIWTCTLAVRTENYDAPVEAFLTRCALEAGDFRALREAFGATLPVATLARLEQRGVLNVSPKGGFSPGPMLEDMETTYEAIRTCLARSNDEHVDIKVVRNLLTGAFHKIGVCANEHVMQAGDARLDGDWPHHPKEATVVDVVTPYRGALQRQFDMSTKDLYAALELRHHEREAKELDLAFTWSVKSDGTKMARASINGNTLAVDLLDAGVIRELRPQREGSEVRRSWELAPELQALEAVDTAAKYIRACEKNAGDVRWEVAADLTEGAVAACEHALALVEQGTETRLNHVETVVGTEWEQWNVVDRVIGSSRSKCVMLSAFTHDGFADAVAGRLSTSLPDKAAILLLSGEPNRINEPEFQKKMPAYLKALRRDGCESNIIAQLTEKATHAKFVVSDAGECWIGSCNLLSAAPDSWVMETGIHARDHRLALSVLEWALTEGLVQGEAKSFVDAMVATMAGTSTTAWALKSQVRNDVGKFCGYLTELGRIGPATCGKAKSYLNVLGRILRSIAERPRWVLVNTAEHRPLMLDLVRSARKSISIGSDGVSQQGLDRALMLDISERPGQVEHRTTRFQVNMFWGRHDPEHIPKRDKEATTAAGSLVHELRGAVRQQDQGARGLRTQFQPFKSSKPMMTHAKFIAVDGVRALVTSDNLLSFGDDEERSTDASELGILLDHPRSAKELVADMQFFIPETQNDFSRDRWYGRIGAIARRYDGRSVSASQVIEELTRIAQSNEAATEDFFTMVSNHKVRGQQLAVEYVPYQMIQEAEKDGFVTVQYSIKEGGKKKTSGLKPRDRNIAMDDKRLAAVAVRTPGPTHAWRKEDSKPDYAEALNRFLKKHGSDVDGVIDGFLVEALTALDGSGRRDHVVIRFPHTYRFAPPNVVTLLNERGFVLKLFNEHKETVEGALTEAIGTRIRIKTAMLKKPKQDKKDTSEPNPEAYVQTFLTYMVDENEFQYSNSILVKMLKEHPELKIPGVRRYIAQRCAKYLDLDWRDEPYKNALWVRRKQ